MKTRPLTAHAVITKLKAVAKRGLPSLRNYVFSQFDYWPVGAMNGHWIAQMPIYCINLDRAKGRHRLMERQARRMGLEQFHFVSATDASAFTIDEATAQGLYDPTESQRWHKSGLSRNEIACSLSHAECYRRIVEAGHARAIVLEDDALFRTARLKRLHLSDIPEWVDVLFLNAFMTRTPPGDRIASSIYTDREYHGSTAAYLITLRTAQRLLDTSKPVIHAADGLVGRALAPLSEAPHAFRQQGSALGLRGAIVFPEVVTNGSTEHYHPSTIR
jgi:glycosyl transferase family 25